MSLFLSENRKSIFLTVSVGERIRQIRRAKDVTQEDVADQLGMAVSSISNIETGKTDPDSTLLIRIAKVLGVRVVDFFSDSRSHAHDGELSIREPARIYFSMPGSISEEEKARYQELMRRLEDIGPGDVETILKLIEAVFPKKK